MWGDVVGVVDSLKDSRSLIGGKETIVRKGLENIIRILEDTDALKIRYGVSAASLEGQLHDTAGISLSALKRFQLRFGKIDRSDMLRKTRWGIYEASKFENLIKDIRDFVDGLTSIVPGDIQNQRIEDDIANLVDDLETLEILSEACEEEYPSLHIAAGRAIDASEHGTYTPRSSTKADTFPKDAALTAPELATISESSVKKPQLDDGMQGLVIEIVNY